MLIIDNEIIKIEELKKIIYINEKETKISCKNKDYLIKGEYLNVIYFEKNEIIISGKISEIKLYEN